MYYPIGWPKRLRFKFKDPDPRDLHSEEGLQQQQQQPENGNGLSQEPTQNGHPDEREDAETSSTSTSSRSCHNRRILQVAANSDRSLFVVLTAQSIHVWYSKPSVEIVSHCRHQQSLRQLGENETVHWKPDSTMIVVKTTGDVLIFYNIAFKDDKVEFVFLQTDHIPLLKRESAELMVPDKIPGLYLFMSFSTKVTPGISSVLAAEEEVVVSTKGGELIGINWDGSLDPNFRWEVSDGIDDEYLVQDIKYSSLIGGFSLVFANGKLAFMPIHYNPDSDSSASLNPGPSSPVTASAATNSSPGSSSGSKIMQRRPSLPNVSSRVQFVPEVDNGVTSSINHKYQLISYGLKNSEGIICIIDDENSVVLITHRIRLPVNSIPESSLSSMGSMCCMHWSPDSMVLATSWEFGGIALWSVFGALLMCSLSWDYGVGIESLKLSSFIVSSIAWSREGYQLWLVARSSKEEEESTNGNNKNKGDSLMQMSLAKSILASNPSAVCSCRESLLLVSEDKVYLGVGNSSSSGDTSNGSSSSSSTKTSVTEEETLPSTNSSSSRMEWKQQPVEVGNHQWIVIQIPFSYLSSNCPVRLASIDKTGSCVAIAGRTGFAHYSLLHRKWKLFGNESQEKDFEVCGGILYHESHIILSCYNIPETSFEIRAYPRESRLDNQFMKVMAIPSEVLAMSIHGEKMITLQIDGSISLFGLSHRTRYQFLNRRESATSTSSSISTTSLGVNSSASTFTLIHLNQIIISNLVIPPECVISIFLTSLHLEPTVIPSHPQQQQQPESILVNVCGRVFLLEKESDSDSQNVVSNGGPPGIGGKALSYRAVSILASGVENVWVSDEKSTSDQPSDRPHLTDALWLSRGCNGMNVWLPLFPSQSERLDPRSTAHTFMSKRIMLPINTHIYPLAVLFRDAVVIGAENDSIFWGKSCPLKLPFSTISRTSQVYLHPILRELIKKNLGIHAWLIANSCSSLPHFPHSLELLLHETLEEEATSSQPIPDPLLPRVVKFIREFPVFLQTVAHCARKTELALWPHLFDKDTVGNPRDLFQDCLNQGLLDTAASYLLVLQTLDRPSSRRYASMLLETAKESNRKKLVSDLTRFLESIDPSDFESPPVNKSSTHASGSHPPLGSSSLIMMNSHVKYHYPSLVSTGDHHPHYHEGSIMPGMMPGRKRTASSSAALMLHTQAGVTASGPLSPPISSQHHHQNSFQVQQTANNIPSSDAMNNLTRSFSLTTRKLPTNSDFGRSGVESNIKSQVPSPELSADRDTSLPLIEENHGRPMLKVSRSVSEPLRSRGPSIEEKDSTENSEHEEGCHSLTSHLKDENKIDSLVPTNPGKAVFMSNGSVGGKHPLAMSSMPPHFSGGHSKALPSKSSANSNMSKSSSRPEFMPNGYLIQTNNRSLSREPQQLDAASIHSNSSLNNDSGASQCIMS